MQRLSRYLILALFFFSTVAPIGLLAQAKKKSPALSKREAAKKSMHLRDSLVRTLNRSDTSISTLLQRVEQYTTTFNQINNTLSEGFDTVDVSEGLAPAVKRLNKIDSLTNTHKSSTLRYLFVLRDNLDHIQTDLEDWQSGIENISAKLIQNQNDLNKFSKDTSLKFTPADSALRFTFFEQRKSVRALWKKTDSVNRAILSKVNLLQDKLSIAYTKTLDETDQIDLKIKQFAKKAFAGESNYIWQGDPEYKDFGTALKSTLKLNKFLFNYFIKTETQTHLAGILFFVLFFCWILFVRRKTFRNNEHPEVTFEQAVFIYKRPVLSAILTGTAIIPYFYAHPPVVFLEIFFLASIVLTLIFVKKEHQNVFNFLIRLLGFTLIYVVSNLFIQLSNVDRYVILISSVASIALAYNYLTTIKKDPENHLTFSKIALQIFISMQAISLLLNITGRFSLAKIISITAVYNLWLLVILFFVIQIIIQGLFLQFQARKDTNSILNWLDYNVIEKKFRRTLIILGGLVWTFFLLQNLNIDDWVSDYISDILGESRTVGGASFTFGGFVIFIAVIWLSSIVSKIISYFYDVSAQRVTDLSVAKKRNRTSTLLIRLGVFSVGFLLAVAASGFPLEKLTIIISAFGIGIGFGLQNIVNNLVSGLILAFEKPINIGDVVQVDGHMGTMKEIGIRSSRVVTGDGSEVIIPNGDLISHQVINWTLSNSNRQIELRIITAYGIDVSKVIETLKTLLSNREDIMSTPAPAVLLNNISDNVIEFKVLFWVPDINMTGSLKSKILTEIYQAIGKEGIPIPSTQKDINLHFPDGIPMLNIDKPVADDKTGSQNEKRSNENLPEKDQ